MKLVRTISTSIKDKFRTIKTKMAVNLIETAKQANPHGFDSIPPENVVAILANTSSKEEPVILGYLFKGAIEELQVGESIQYATDKEGNIKSSIILRSDGTGELLGTGDFLVRYSALETEVNKLINAWDTFATAYVPGGPSIQGLPPTASPSNADITKVKIEELKTK